jgi:hypothetical protein
VNDRELRLRARIDVLTTERDQARAERDRANVRIVKLERLARQLAGDQLEAWEALHRRIARLTETRSRVRRSRDCWMARARDAEAMLNRLHSNRRRYRRERAAA